ncbi:MULTISPECIES: nitroreductase family protein [unclassified Methylophaga]|jgi:nitroreductase|uniref:nitroreductase family protein n=1 Tax=unclassified Methylophaga TaxID=2629249 RepID=UPI00259C9C56|nr:MULTISPECIES: nitroreductase family protein [unclassified Methylophaga]|tara:strand:- start:17973 stop:18563 length:591 start_codon:yes stop_codon:yes gene_type:complete
MIQKPADTAQPIEKVMAERWSGRAYDPTVMVSQEEITALCEAARWAPSCFGDEPWRYLVCDKNTDRTAWEKLLSALAPGNQEWAKNAPVLILTASVPLFSQNDKPNRWSGYDTGAASISLCLQATSMGLMSHQMGGFDDKKIREAFAISDDIHMWSVIAIGHQAVLDNLTEEQLERELSPRQRRPLEQAFFMNKWS